MLYEDWWTIYLCWNQNQNLLKRRMLNDAEWWVLLGDVSGWRWWWWWRRVKEVDMKKVFFVPHHSVYFAFSFDEKHFLWFSSFFLILWLSLSLFPLETIPLLCLRWTFLFCCLFDWIELMKMIENVRNWN